MDFTGTSFCVGMLSDLPRSYFIVLRSRTVVELVYSIDVDNLGQEAPVIVVE